MRIAANRLPFLALLLLAGCGISAHEDPETVRRMQSIPPPPEKTLPRLPQALGAAPPRPAAAVEIGQKTRDALQSVRFDGERTPHRFQTSENVPPIGAVSEIDGSIR